MKLLQHCPQMSLGLGSIRLELWRQSLQCWQRQFCPPLQRLLLPYLPTYHYYYFQNKLQQRRLRVHWGIYLPPSLSLAQSNLLSLSVAELAFDIKISQITRHNLESRLLSSCRGGRRLIKLDQHWEASSIFHVSNKRCSFPRMETVISIILS